MFRGKNEKAKFLGKKLINRYDEKSSTVLHHKQKKTFLIDSLSFLESFPPTCNLLCVCVHEHWTTCNTKFSFLKSHINGESK